MRAATLTVSPQMSNCYRSWPTTPAATAQMNADPDLPPELRLDQGRCHFNTAAGGRTDRILEFLEEPARCHKSIADSLDFLKAVSGCDPLENDEEGRQVATPRPPVRAGRNRA